MTRDTQRKTVAGLTIPELLLVFALIGGVVGGVSYLKAQAQEQVQIHDEAYRAHPPITARLDNLEKRVSDIEYWMTVSHKQEVDRAIKEITDNITKEIHKP